MLDLRACIAFSFRKISRHLGHWHKLREFVIRSTELLTLEATT